MTIRTVETVDITNMSQAELQALLDSAIADVREPVVITFVSSYSLHTIRFESPEAAALGKKALRGTGVALRKTCYGEDLDILFFFEARRAGFAPESYEAAIQALSSNGFDVTVKHHS